MNFDYCPACRTRQNKSDSPFICDTCGFTFYQNVACATAAIIENNNKILLIRRNRKPKKGMLDLPGGFVDPNESAEIGLLRELKEELSLEVSEEELSYFGSFPNKYEYKNTIYNTPHHIPQPK